MKLFLLPGKLYLVQRDWELKKTLINDCNKYCDGISAKFRLEKAFIPISLLLQEKVRANC